MVTLDKGFSIWEALVVAKMCQSHPFSVTSHRANEQILYWLARNYMAFLFGYWLMRRSMSVGLVGQLKQTRTCEKPNIQQKSLFDCILLKVGKSVPVSGEQQQECGFLVPPRTPDPSFQG